MVTEIKLPMQIGSYSRNSGLSAVDWSRLQHALRRFPNLHSVLIIPVNPDKQFYKDVQQNVVRELLTSELAELHEAGILSIKG